jgi:hypothetical protein
MKQEESYEAPVVRDLEELGLEGQFPLGVNTCSAGTDAGCPVGNDDNYCTAGSGHAPCNPLGAI